MVLIQRAEKRAVFEYILQNGVIVVKKVMNIEII